MNPKTTVRRAVPILATAALLSLASVPALARVDCANPQGVGQARACAIAPQGATELRRFIERTAPIYLLSYKDFADRVPESSAKADNVKVAANK
jgi:hypothetical protein